MACPIAISEVHVCRTARAQSLFAITSFNITNPNLVCIHYDPDNNNIFELRKMLTRRLIEDSNRPRRFISPIECYFVDKFFWIINDICLVRKDIVTRQLPSKI
jgi:hypothetical protein